MTSEREAAFGIVVPEWADQEDQPSPEQWLAWFLTQSEVAQLHIVRYHLALDLAVAGIREQLEAGSFL